MQSDKVNGAKISIQIKDKTVTINYVQKVQGLPYKPIKVHIFYHT